MKLRAAVLEEFGAPLEVQELDLAEPGPGEVLVRLVACGVCHTDLYTASGADPSGYAPAVRGHEGAGVVERVGADVGSLAEGDHVVSLFSPQCGECIHCRSPKTGQGATETTVGGPDAVQQILDMTGGFGADYAFEATGNVKVMRQAVEAARMGWGLCTVAGVAGEGETLDVVPRLLITGPPHRRLLVRRRQGPPAGAGVRRALPRGRHRRRRLPLAPHRPRRGQPRLRADGGAGRHPQRDLSHDRPPTQPEASR